MMKCLLITVTLLSSMNAFGQEKNFYDIPKEILEKLDKMGINDSLALNCYESSFLNAFFENSLNEFDFTDKKIGFIQGIGGNSNKKEYFKEMKERFYRNDSTISSYLCVFDATQKEESGGYDAAIVYWSKRLIPIDEVVKRLKENR